MSVKLLTEHHLEFLSLKGGFTGSYESSHIKMPHCWKSHVTAHIITLISVNIVPSLNVLRLASITNFPSCHVINICGTVHLNIYWKAESYSLILVDGKGVVYVQYTLYLLLNI